MKTKLHWMISILVITVLVFSVAAIASMLIPASDKAKEESEADNSPVVKKAGDNLVLTSPGLERRIFIHYAKPGTECGNGICEPSENPKNCPADCQPQEEGESTCYAFLGKWVKWKELLVNYVIDPDNPYGLTKEFITDAICAGAEEWNSWTSAGLFGAYSIDYDATWDIDAPDGRNELLFGNYSEQRVIAVTVVWGYFSGPPGNRKIVEFDILFNTDFSWGDATVDSAVMDLQNIATHELGHGAGLDDLYETACSEETMYGYSDYGETKKRDLGTGDITGIQELYGD